MDVRVAQLEALYAAQGRGLLAYLRRRTGSAEEAEDLLHETFVEAARCWDRLAVAASPQAWLFGVARHRAGGLVRRWMRRRHHERAAALAVVRQEAEDERLEVMRRAVMALPDHYREPLELRLQEGLSYAEVAGVLGVPVGTVRSRIHTAVERLRAALTGAPDGVVRLEDVA